MPKPSKTWISKLVHLERMAVLVIAVLILTIGVGVWKLAGYLDEQNKTYFADVPNVDVNTYSLSGKVTKADLDSVELEVGQVVAGKDGNSIEYKKYTARIVSTTAVLKRNASGKYDPGLIRDIQVGKELTVYTNENPYAGREIIATKIELN